MLLSRLMNWYDPALFMWAVFLICNFISGYNTTIYPYPQAENGRSPYFNQYDEITIDPHSWQHSDPTGGELLPDIAQIYWFGDRINLLNQVAPPQRGTV